MIFNRLNDLLKHPGPNYCKELIKSAKDNHPKTLLDEEMRESLGVFGQMSAKRKSTNERFDQSNGKRKEKEPAELQKKRRKLVGDKNSL